MPVYSYICKDCKAEFDLLIGVTSEKTEEKCEKCSSKNIERIFSSFSVGSSSGGSASESCCPTCSDGTCSL